MSETVAYPESSDARVGAPVVRRLPLIEAGARWDEIAPILARAMAEGPAYQTIDDLQADVAAEMAHIWTAHEDDGRVAMAMAVKLVQRPQMRVCFIELLAAAEPGAGAFARFYEPALAELTTWARTHGCSVIEATGLPRFAELSGWRSCATIWKEI